MPSPLLWRALTLGSLSIGCCPRGFQEGKWPIKACGDLKRAEKKRTLQKRPFGQPFLRTTPSAFYARLARSDFSFLNETFRNGYATLSRFGMKSREVEGTWRLLYPAVGNYYLKYSWEYFMQKLMHNIFLHCGQPEYFR